MRATFSCKRADGSRFNVRGEAPRARGDKTLAELRDLLLPKLLSGELRVEAAEDQVQSATASASTG
jgi:hypothetical protein